MTFDLVFVGATSGAATLAQLSADLGVPVATVAQRPDGMEIFPVSIVTVRVDAGPDSADAVDDWFRVRGIHRLAA